jgi:small subunit ribosomal protein S1
MPDTNVNPPDKPTPKLSPDRTASYRSDDDDAYNAALDADIKRGAKGSGSDTVPLKRLWDADMEAELEAALTGFDPASFAVGSPRSRPDRTLAPKGERGQEGKPGPRKGKVIRARGNILFVDMGGKSEGIIGVDQFPEDLPEPGSLIDVVIDRFDPAEGVLILRLKGAAIDATWENLRKGVVVEARATKSIKGGLEVDVDGIRGFMPISQIDLARVEDAAAFVNQKFKAVVTEANEREKNLVISRRELLEQERAEQRERTWATLEEGQVRDGVVRSIKDFGAFVDLGGVDGLLPIGEMSWSRVSKADDLVKIGDTVKVKVLKIDRTARKLTLGLKQLSPSPWEGIATKFPRGAMVKGKVTKIMDFGAFVELEPGIEGLLHISELSPTRVRRVVDIVKPEQEVEVRILKVEAEERKISLSLLPAFKGNAVEAKAKAEDQDDDEDETPPTPRPEPKIPLKGGLGDRDWTKF